MISEGSCDTESLLKSQLCDHRKRGQTEKKMMLFFKFTLSLYFIKYFEKKNILTVTII